MSDPVNVDTLKHAALYQQIVGEIVTLFHISLVGLILWLYARWKRRRETLVRNNVSAGSTRVPVVCLACGAMLTAQADVVELAKLSGWAGGRCARCLFAGKEVV